jgi:hypothetical protein
MQTRPHTLDRYSAKDRYLGRRLTFSFGEWLEKCERHDDWRELPDDKRAPTIENVAAFLDDYVAFEKVEPS